MKDNMVKLSVYSRKALFLLPVFAFAFLLPTNAHAGALGNNVIGLLNTVNNIAGGAISSVINSVGSIFNQLGLGWLFNQLVNWLFGVGTCGEKVAGGVGEVLCNVVNSSTLLPGLISGIAYILGLILAVVAVLKLKEHVVNPNQTPLSDSMKRFVAGGALFSLPSITGAARDLLIGTGGRQVAAYDMSGGFSGASYSSGGLDSMLTSLVADIWEPLQILLASFSYLAGLVLVVVGIGRLIKTAQDGPRGPASVGTVMTFVTAGVLFSLDNIMGAFSTSMFATNDVATYAILSDTTGDIMVDQHIEGVISAVLAFMALIGWISFIRGFFILRDVAEGNGQASLMAATTHMFGGALAVNLGPLMNAVQSTLGLSSYGVCFDTFGGYC